jgi:signal transduction histidine kinase
MLEISIRYTIERANTAFELKSSYDELEERVKQRTRDLQKANEKLHNASKKIKSFAYSVSHDLKSPSTALIGLVQRFYEIYHDSIDEKGKVYCEQIKNSAKQIHSLVGMINGFITAKETSLKIENINLEEILNYIEANYSEEFSARNISWIKPEKFPTIRADRMCLTRILINLVENALKYGGSELSTISIEISENYNEYILSVNDNGKGLVKTENLDIFQAFERCNVSNSIEGNGLGLAIVKELAERHGGDVWYDSSVQKGASFHISISKSIS